MGSEKEKALVICVNRFDCKKSIKSCTGAGLHEEEATCLSRYCMVIHSDVSCKPLNSEK